MHSGKSPGAEQRKSGLQGRKSDSEAGQTDVSNAQEILAEVVCSA